jgi:hypothetical protein
MVLYSSINETTQKASIYPVKFSAHFGDLFISFGGLILYIRVLFYIV